MGSPVVVASPRKSPLSGRRINKPLVEKKRRARINGCLGQLKSLILNAMHTEQGAQVSRLEKADILEMTVNYLRQIQSQQVTAVVPSEPDVVAKFSAGYSECATEVIRYMDSVKCVAPDVKSRLESHLVHRLRGSVPADPCDGGAPTVYMASSGNPGNDPYTRQVSSTSTTPDEINRHYQTAVDLASMASSEHAKENPAAAAATRMSNTAHPLVRSARPTSAISPAKILPSDLSEPFCVDNTSKCMPSSRIYTSNEMYHSNAADLIPSKSITSSPRLISREPSVVMISSLSSMYDNSDSRHSRECLEPAISCSAYSSASTTSMAPSDFNNNYSNIRRSKHLSNVTSSVNNISNYLSNFQHPLHIHIPDSAALATPSPPFLHPHMTYSQESINSESATSPTTTYTYDDSPPTILYGCQEYLIQVENTSSPESSQEFIQRPATVNDQNMNPLQYDNNNFHSTTDGNITSRHQPEPQTYANRVIESMDISHQSQVQCSRTLPEGGRRVTPTPLGRLITPSPPVLLSEDSYSVQTTSRHSHTNNYSNLAHHDSVHLSHHDSVHLSHHDSVHLSHHDSVHLSHHDSVHLSHHDSVHLSARLMVNYEEVCTDRLTDRNNNNYAKFHHSKNSYPRLANFPLLNNRHLTTATTMNSSTECPSALVPRTVPINNGLTLPRAPFRQNDTPLSPPTLKKRLLLAQGSEVDWTTPRCRGMNVDKRSYPLDSGLSECGQNPRFWHDPETRSLLSRQAHSLVPNVLFCAVPGHAISGDDLWRPW